MTDKINYKMMGFGEYWGTCFKMAGRCFWAIFGLGLVCGIGALVIGIVGALVLRELTPSLIIVYVITLLYYVSAVGIVGSRIQGAPAGIFESLQAGGVHTFHFIIAAVLMSVPISAVSLGLNAAGINDLRLIALLDIAYLFALLYAAFTLAAIVLRDMPFWEAFKHSFSIVKNNYWKTLGYLASVFVFSAAVYLAFYGLVILVSIIGGITGASLHSMSPSMFETLSMALFVGLAVGVAAAIFFTWLTSFIYSAYALLFFKLEAAAGADALDFDELEKTKPAQTVVPAAEPLKNYDDLPESEKFYRSIFDKANAESDEHGGEMPTIYVDTANVSDHNIEKILQKRLREREKNRQKQDNMENTVTLSQQNLEIHLEDTEYLPENDSQQPKEPLPPPGPVAPRLKVVNVPPPPPNKNKNDEDK
ncbi:MAG: hypothetical protein FWF35_04600 [Elusimicrobia bacterium]|nr:hypothetical protein [Elusimicrobiota bacterium]